MADQHVPVLSDGPASLGDSNTTLKRALPATENAISNWESPSRTAASTAPQATSQDRPRHLPEELPIVCSVPASSSELEMTQTRASPASDVMVDNGEGSSRTANTTTAQAKSSVTIKGEIIEEEAADRVHSAAMQEVTTTRLTSALIVSMREIDAYRELQYRIHVSGSYASLVASFPSVPHLASATRGPCANTNIMG
jgi:hypothetical protein